MKAADIPDERIYEIVRKAPVTTFYGITQRSSQDRWTIHAALPEFPPAIVDAKLYQMVNKKRLDGCVAPGKRHNCRGDFTIPAAIEQKEPACPQ